jgi:hypothetical protein
MGSCIELNDTLQITTEQGFPADLLNLEKHWKEPIKASDFEGNVFEFRNKPGARLYHTPPCRCFLVHNIGGKWLYWGKALVIEQTISGEGKGQVTSGKFRIIEIYDPEYQKQITKNETDEGKSYF